MKDSKLFWDKSAAKYVKSPIKDEATYQKKLAITQEYLDASSQVFEFGCGSGATAIYHAPLVESIVATDLSEKMIEIAQQKARESGIDNITFEQGSLDDLSFPEERFDAVLGLNVLHLLEDVDSAISRVHRLLKPEGYFVSSSSLIGEVNIVFRGLISVMQTLGLAPFVARFTKQQLVSKLISAGFSIEHEWRTSHESVFIVARKV